MSYPDNVTAEPDDNCNDSLADFESALDASIRQQAPHSQVECKDTETTLIPLSGGQVRVLMSMQLELRLDPEDIADIDAGIQSIGADLAHLFTCMK